MLSPRIGILRTLTALTVDETSTLNGQVFVNGEAIRPEPTTTNNPFTDVIASEYYGKAVIWAADNKIVYGTSTTQFSPDASCTRAQIVSFLYRTYGK